MINIVGPTSRPFPNEMKLISTLEDMKAIKQANNEYGEKEDISFTKKKGRYFHYWFTVEIYIYIYFDEIYILTLDVYHIVLYRPTNIRLQTYSKFK